jgi:hypothetical protein
MEASGIGRVRDRLEWLVEAGAFSVEPPQFSGGNRRNDRHRLPKCYPSEFKRIPGEERPMMNQPSALKGVIHGKTIELESESGLPDGQEVTVRVEAVTDSSLPRPSPFLSDETRSRWEEAWAQVKDLPPGEGLRRAFGAWAEDAEEVDRFLEWNRAQRKLERRSPDL